MRCIRVRRVCLAKGVVCDAFGCVMCDLQLVLCSMYSGVVCDPLNMSRRAMVVKLSYFQEINDLSTDSTAVVLGCGRCHKPLPGVGRQLRCDKCKDEHPRKCLHGVSAIGRTSQ